MANTWRIDCERRMEMDVFNIFQKSFPQFSQLAGLHISPSVILDKEIGLVKQFLCYLVTSQITHNSNIGHKLQSTIT